MKRQRSGQSPRLSYPPWQSAFSLNALRRAWLIIRANKGSGGDGETLATFEETLESNLTQLRGELLNGSYRPQAVKQVLVPKSDSRWRPITLWTVRDKIAQRAVYDYLDPIWETCFLPCSYGFRAGRSTEDVAEAILAVRQRGAVWVFDADITDCFGRMRTDRLLQLLHEWRVPRPLVDVIRHWLQARIFNAWRGGRTLAGTSQGGVISPLLCNLYLHAFDEQMQQTECYLIRYADDFVLLGRKKRAVLAGQAHATTTLNRFGLEINPHKSRITHFDEGFQFVGWFFINNRTFPLR